MPEAVKATGSPALPKMISCPFQRLVAGPVMSAWGATLLTRVSPSAEPAAPSESVTVTVIGNVPLSP